MGLNLRLIMMWNERGAVQKTIYIEPIIMRNVPSQDITNYNIQSCHKRQHPNVSQRGTYEWVWNEHPVHEYYLIVFIFAIRVVSLLLLRRIDASPPCRCLFGQLPPVQSGKASAMVSGFEIVDFG